MKAHLLKRLALMGTLFVVVAVGFVAAVLVFLDGLVHQDYVGAVLGLAAAAACGYIGWAADYPAVER